MPERRKTDPRPSEEPETGGRRRDLLRPSKAQGLVAVILCLCAFAVVAQMRSRDHQDPFATMRRADLVSMLDSLSTSSRQLDSELADLRETQRQLESGADSRRAAQAQAARRLSQLKVLEGTVPVAGPGVTIRIEDPRSKVSSDMILDAVEELRDAGAEALAINGSVRVVASTWFASGADGLTVSGRAVTRPITITAIGDPHSLEEGAKFRGGMVSQMQAAQVGATVTITPSQQVRIDAVATPRPLSHATPVR
ncbi:DUF881 domain-containing protein [Acidipropionibacterium virtanenii]|uniref:Uncharacterized protein n=1 Tax=Acidipropionibacterium virtanenii TaxID=2057246 RepID=A0A344UUG2_9ACTN|nr:DUF881 domain-containing protein [Acidipropionibacterium virtanenii]AXE38910.1 hypothetical protein JS278_01747 [Acidipropionibacterium virtanenii]